MPAIQRFRLKATTNAATPGHDVVSNAHMRYVADPLSEDPGVSPPTPPPVEDAKVSTPSRAAASKGKKGGGGKEQNATEGQPEEGGRLPILKVLRECVGEHGCEKDSQFPIFLQPLPTLTHVWSR